MKFPTVSVAELLKSGEAEVKTGPFGTQLKASDYVSEGTPVINVRNIGFGNIREDKLEYIGKETVQRLASHLLRPEDIVFGRKGAVERHVFIQAGQSNWFQGSDCLRLRLSSGRIFPRFASYYLLTHEHQQWMMGQCSHGATMASLNQDIISRIHLPCPPIDTQRRIASILSAYDELIENNTRRIAILEEMARRIFEEWFVRFRFPGHELDRPSWRNVQLGEIGIIQTGPFGSQLHQSDYVDDGVPVTMPKDIALNRIDVSSVARIPEQLADQLGRHRMRPGDIVYGRRGDIGRKAFIGARQEGWLCGTGCLLIRPNPEQVAPRFLFDALGAPETLGLIKGRAKGVTMPNLSGGLMQSVPLSLPPRELQDRYVMTVSPMVELLETLTERNRNLRATRDLLLPKLISGELDVSTLPEPEEAIAA